MTDAAGARPARRSRARDAQSVLRIAPIRISFIDFKPDHAQCLRKTVLEQCFDGVPCFFSEVLDLFGVRAELWEN